MSTKFSFSLSLSEIHFEKKEKALQQESSRGKNILPFVTQNQPSVPSLKSIFMKHWQLIENQLLLLRRTDLQRTSNYIAQTRKVSKGYTRYVKA